MLGLVLVVCLGGGREASARLTGQARTDYFKWSIDSCLRSAAAAKDLLDIARADSSPAGIRRFCECMAGEEANRLSSRRSGDRFMAALRQALPVCLQTPLTIRPSMRLGPPIERAAWSARQAPRLPSGPRSGIMT